VLPRVLLLVLVSLIAVGGWIATCVLWRYQDAVEEIGVLETRRFETPTLLVLGSGGATENPSRLGPALAFGAGERVVLVDAGRGVAERLRAARIPPAQPDTVLLTSLLPENTLGLDDLLLAGWRSGRARPLRVIGPDGSTRLLSALETAHAPGIQALARALDLPPEGARFEGVDVAAPWEEERSGVRLRAAARPGGPLPALAWRLEAEGRALVVGSGSAELDGLQKLAHGAQVLAHEAVFGDAVEAATQAGVEDAERVRREADLVLRLRDLARLADRAGVASLVLVRLRPPPLYDFQYERVVGEYFRGRVTVAADGDELTL
jgi:ribonuclease BN (tRNA processing enzyme)